MLPARRGRDTGLAPVIGGQAATFVVAVGPVSPRSLGQLSEQTADFPGIGTWTAEELKAHIAFMKDTNRKLAEAGELVDAQGLAMPETARIVRSHADGVPVVTEGLFLSTDLLDSASQKSM
jgi:hypothetical protein